MERDFEVVPSFNPAFNLIKFGSVCSLTCNEQFAKRLNNILSESSKLEPLTGLLEQFQRELTNSLSSEGVKRTVSVQKNEKFELRKFEHVYTLTFGKEFGQAINEQVSGFLKENEVSPPMFSFARHLDGCLFQKRRGYADEC